MSSYLFLDLCQDSRVGENPSKSSTFPIQERVAERRVGSNLDGDWSLPYAESASSFKSDQWGDHSKAEALRCFVYLHIGMVSFERERPRTSRSENVSSERAL